MKLELQKLETEYLKNATLIFKLKKRQKAILKEAGEVQKKDCPRCAHLGFDFDEVGIKCKCNER